MTREIQSSLPYIPDIESLTTPRPSVRESSTLAVEYGMAELTIQEQLASYAELLANAKVHPEDIAKNCANMADIPENPELVAMRVDVIATIAHPRLQEKMRTLKKLNRTGMQTPTEFPQS